MPQRVNVPGVGIVEFPDGMSDQDIGAALQKNFPQIHPPQQAQQQQQSPGMLEQAGQFGKEMLQSGGRQLLTAATAVPGMAADAATGAYNLIRGRDANGQYPMNMPTAQMRENLSPVLGRAPGGVGGVAEDIGSAVLGSKVPIPGAPAATDTASGLSSNLQKVADRGSELGMRTTPAQAAGSVTGAKLEARLEALPVTSHGFDKIATKNADVVNKTWSNAIGEVNATAPDAETMAAAAKRTGAIFDGVRDSTTRAFQPGEVNNLIVDQAKELRGIPGGDSFLANPLVADLIGFAKNGGATGKQLGSLSSQLGKAAYSEATSPNGNRDVAKALGAVKDKVDDLVERGLSEADAGDYNAARSQYRALMQLVSSRAVNSSTGEVNGSMLARYLQRTDRKGFTFGNNDSDHYAATRFAQAFAPKVGNSGTATRSFKLTDIPEHVLGAAFSALYLHGGGSAAMKGISRTTLENLYKGSPAFQQAVSAQMDGSSEQGPQQPPLQAAPQ